MGRFVVKLVDLGHACLMDAALLSASAEPEQWFIYSQVKVPSSVSRLFVSYLVTLSRTVLAFHLM